MRYEDLPAAAQAQVKAQHPDAVKTTRRTSQHADTSPGHWRCACGEELHDVKWPAVERHQDQCGHRRAECIL